METRIALLINLAVQKLIKLVAQARNLQLQGYAVNDLFCELTKLKSIIVLLQFSKEISLGKLEEIELLVKNIGDKNLLSYRPLVVQPNVEILPKTSCCADQQIKNDIVDLTKFVNYEKPWLKIIPIGFETGKHEVGVGLITLDVSWSANKIPLDLIQINFPDDASRASANLIGTHTGITLDFTQATELSKKIDGFYNDREAYKGVHLLAQDELCFETVWPCYWGKGTMDQLDNPAQINAFALSLTRELSCTACVEADLQEGEVLYFFFPYKGKAKQFVSDNGVINESFKGTIEQFKTQSLISNSLPGDTVYGIIRSDQPGIGSLKVCVKELEWTEQEVETPIVVTDQISYEGTWFTVSCVKQNDLYEAIWDKLICVLEDNGL